VMRGRFSGRVTPAQQAMCGSVCYRDAETSVPVACMAASSELHRATSTKLARINDQSRRYELMVHHCRFQRIPGTF
jgi:hypothetical protein